MFALPAWLAVCMAQDLADAPMRIAQVNDEVISYKDLKEFCEEFSPERWMFIERNFQGKERMERRQTLMRSILPQLVGSKTLLQKAKTEELKSDLHKEFIETILNDSMRDYIRRAGSLQQLYEDLRKRGKSISELKNRYRERLIVERHLYRLIRKWVTVRPEEIRDYFLEHKGEEFQQAEQFVYRHIWISPREYESPQDAEKQARVLLKQVMETKGENFAQLADMFSYDRLERPGGECRTNPETKLSARLREVLLRLEPGEVYPEVIETATGYRLLKLIEKTPARKLEFQEVSPEIERRLKARKTRERTDSYVENLMSRSYIVYEKGWEPLPSDQATTVMPDVEEE
ncbi:MAG TPA: peptidyl-prolyl cis-trans isomerase [Candidatus Brocadiia bacterium]|nr:peptidyl-prolyl cis-trans isomerase [Candidatus Brocadiia bacterium]